MSSVDGRLLTCDRCDKAVFLRATPGKIEFPEYEKAPGWGYRSGIGDLCPECLADLDRLINEFMKGCENEDR